MVVLNRGTVSFVRIPASPLDHANTLNVARVRKARAQIHISAVAVEHGGYHQRVVRSAVVLSVLFLFDLGYAGQGLLSLLVAAVGFGLLTAGALWSAVRGAAPRARSRALRASLYLVLGLAAFGTARFHAATAETHAASVIEACRAFEARRGPLPNRLDDLIPEFLSAVPRAKYTLAWGAFTYSTAAPNRHTLMYVTLPPFGRRVYHFEENRWSQLD